MIDKLKSLLILVLSFTSVVLLFLNFGMTREDLTIYTSFGERNIIFDSNALLSDAVMAESIGVNFGDETHTLLNNPVNEDIWNNSAELIKEIFEEENKSITSIDFINNSIYNEVLKQESIVLFFKKNISATTLLNGLGVENTKDIVEEFGEIKTIYISLERNFVIINEGIRNHLLTFNSLDVSNIKEQVDILKENGFNPYKTLDEVFKNKNIGYVPVLSEQNIEGVRFHNILETLTDSNIENIVYNFFQKEVNYLREIKEEGIQTIYVDREKILKISEEGLISYFNPEEPQVTERNLYISLDTALSFISNNLGYDSSLYLKEIRTIELQDYSGFKFIFGKSAKSYKVNIQNEDILDYIEIDVYNNHVRRFSQLFRGEIPESTPLVELKPNQEVLSIISKNLININQGLFPNGERSLSFNEILNRVEDASLVYVDKGDESPLDIAWKVEIMDEEFEFILERK